MWWYNDSADYIAEKIKRLYGENSTMTFELDMED